MPDIVNRTNNNEFLAEFKDIFYGRKKLTEEDDTPLQKKLQPHGQQLINFTLTEYLVDEKIKQAAEEQIGKTREKLRTEINQKTKYLKKHMDLKLAKSNMAMNSLQAECDVAHKDVANQMRSNHMEM